MPHPARSFPAPYDCPCLGPGRGDGADRACGEQAQGRPAACTVCAWIRVFPAKAAVARRKWAGGRFAGPRGGAIRVVRGRRVFPRHPLPPVSAILPPPGRPSVPPDTRFGRFLVAGD